MNAKGWVALLSFLGLGGCAGGGTLVNNVATAGVAAGIASATGSPIAGAIVGVAVSFGVDQGVKYGERRIQENVQNAIARAAAPLDVGQSAAWQVTEDLPLWDREGTVEVARSFGEAIPCKDTVFTVGDAPAIYITTICQAKDGIWRWALAEPTVHRWGSLQ